MRAKLMTLVLIAFVAALGFESSSPSVFARENADPSNVGMEATQAARRGRGRQRPKMTGVPKGVDKCIEHLIEMASEDPMTPYEGHPQEIINNGLLWNNAKSKCSIGDNHSLRLKLSELSKAWRENDTSKVRSLLDEIKNEAP